MKLLGRVSNIRAHGGVTFVDVVSQGKMYPCFLSRDQEVFEKQKTLYHGCCLEVILEKSFNNRKEVIYKILSLSLQSKKDLFPDRYPKTNIKDLEIRYKDRPLDLISNLQSYQVLSKRFKIIKILKRFLEDKGFIQVDVPVLDESFGGALAHPFTTKSNYNQKEYFLRISLEFLLKKLVIGGFQNIYAIGPVFRNEDLDSTHSFEFTMLEFYTQRYSYQEVLKLQEELYMTIYQEINRTYVKDGFDLRNPWPRYNSKDIAQLSGMHNLDLAMLAKNKILGPVYHLENLESSPLAKDKFFESYVDYKVELVTAYQEQNDYHDMIDISKSTEYQIKDSSFLNSLRYGMFETVGYGIGIDRLVKSILNLDTIRDTQPLPLI